MINNKGDINEKNKIVKNVSGNIPVGNFLGGNFLGESSPGGSLMGWNFLWGIFPDTVQNSYSKEQKGTAAS